MPERHRSKDGSRDTDRVLGERGEVQEQSTSGGRLAQKIGSKDEKKRASERPAGATRVTKGDNADTGNMGTEKG